jgi:putative hydrolase of HD superfamily
MKELVNFFYEIGQLKRAKRSGWWTAGIKNPESIAEHAFRTAIIGYFLAKQEGANPDIVMRIALFHDIPEARLNDMHKIGQKYVDFKDAERKAFAEQMSSLPPELADDLKDTIEKYQTDGSREAAVARDADLLECACQAKEYIDAGYKATQDWIDNTRQIMKTESGKRLLEEINTMSSNDWWKGLKHIER